MSALRIETDGESKKVFNGDRFIGEVIRQKGGKFAWRNALAHRLSSPFTQGTAESEACALAQLGVRMKNK